jgi:DnaK suppressor protein
MRRVLAQPENGQVESYRRMLLEKRAAVLINLGVRFDTIAAMGRVGEEDQAQISHDEYISLSLNSLGHEQLGMVEEALDRIKVGDYGTCLACGDPIPGKRLKVIPWARFCVTCQDRQAETGSPETDPAEFVLGR